MALFAGLHIESSVDSELRKNPAPPSTYIVDTKSLYQILLDTRNLEIKLFWDRSNYFLVLSTALAVGFFTITNTKYAVVFEVMGLVVAVLWFLVCLGSKYWQTRWEQRLCDFEMENLNGLDFFSASKGRLDSDVSTGLAAGGRPWLQAAIYRLAIRRKPSVSYSMIRLSILFILGWLAIIILQLSDGST